MKMKLNIGGQKGRKNLFKGWTIVDIRKGSDICVDIMESPLPFEKSTVDAIYTSHTLEHIFPDRLPFVLSECFRVLKPGCRIRVVVPDIDKAITAYINGDLKFLQDKRNPRKMGWVSSHPLCYLSSWFFTYKMDKKKNSRLEGGHVMAFNWEVLRHYLSEAGFKEIEKKSYGECRPEFARCDFERYKHCSIYAEATK